MSESFENFVYGKKEKNLKIIPNEIHRKSAFVLIIDHTQVKLHMTFTSISKTALWTSVGKTRFILVFLRRTAQSWIDDNARYSQGEELLLRIDRISIELRCK